MIDEEVNVIIRKAYDTASKLLAENKARLKLIAEKLIAEETIEEAAFEELMKQPLPSLETASAS
jgi:cell division protease FtsH